MRVEFWGGPGWRVKSKGFKFPALGLKIEVLHAGFGVQALRVRGSGLEFRVSGVGCRV